MNPLLSKKCIPCEGGVEALEGKALTDLLAQVPAWRLSEDRKAITREYKFHDFVEGVVFITNVAHVAEEEGHHPNVYLHDYKFVLMTLTTNAIGGLSENDFILAAKIDRVSTD